MPTEARLQRIPLANFVKYRDTLSGLTDENAITVKTKLSEVGVLPSVGTTDATPMDTD